MQGDLFSDSHLPDPGDVTDEWVWRKVEPTALEVEARDQADRERRIAASKRWVDSYGVAEQREPGTGAERRAERLARIRAQRGTPEREAAVVAHREANPEQGELL